MLSTLISVAELAQRLHSPDVKQSMPELVILDCRHDLIQPDVGRNSHAAGHIAHAQFADTNLDLAGPVRDAHGVFQGRHPLPARAELIATLRGWGINDRTQVVAYDAHGGMFAARLWWLLRWIGHPAVAVLDGGLQAWQAQGLVLETSNTLPTRGAISEKPAITCTVSVTDVAANLTSGAYQLIDARAPDRFRGKNETIDPVGGHIPGAKNRCFKDNLQADGRFKSGAQLRLEFALLLGDAKGEAKDASQAIMQCGSGVTACHNLLALELAGMPGAALYPGSWSEWCSESLRPVARGA